MGDVPNDRCNNRTEKEQQPLKVIANRESDARKLAEATDDPTFAAGIRMLLDLANNEEPNPADISKAAGDDVGGVSRERIYPTEIPVDVHSSEETNQNARNTSDGSRSPKSRDSEL